MISKGLLVDRTADVLTFTLDNAENDNQVTGAMFDTMRVELHRQSAQPQARVLHIRAQGSIFCKGRERSGHDVESIVAEVERIIELKRLLRVSPLISVAAVQGDAFGFGCGLAILCDFVLASEKALFALPEMRSGLPPSAIMAYLGEYALPRFAFPMVLFGDPISAQHAVQIGLVSQVCPADRLSQETEDLIERVLRLDPVAVRRCKQFFLTAQQNSFDQNCRLAAEALTIDSLTRLAKRK